MGDGAVRFFSAAAAQKVLGRYANISDGLTLNQN